MKHCGRQLESHHVFKKNLWQNKQKKKHHAYGKFGRIPVFVDLKTNHPLGFISVAHTTKLCQLLQWEIVAPCKQTFCYIAIKKTPLYTSFACLHCNNSSLFYTAGLKKNFPILCLCLLHRTARQNNGATFLSSTGCLKAAGECAHTDGCLHWTHNHRGAAAQISAEPCWTL